MTAYLAGCIIALFILWQNGILQQAPFPVNIVFAPAMFIGTILGEAMINWES